MIRNLVILVLGLAMFSCGDAVKAPKYLPNSGGGIDEVMVLAEDGLWKSHLETPMTELLNKEFEILPQYEPSYTFAYVNYASLRGLIKEHRNIIVLANLADGSQVSDLVTKVLGEEYTAQALNDPNFSYAIKRDVWAKPQIIFFVFASTAEQLVANIAAKGPEILGILSQHEVKHKYTPGLYTPTYNIELTKKVSQHLNLYLRIPPEYFQAVEQPNFLWFRWEPKESSNNLFVFTEPLPDSIDPKRPIYLRDSLGKAYVSTKLEGAYMATDTANLGIVQRYIALNGYRILETRGLWQMENDFMGGPFLNYYILDTANNRAVMLDGFVYAPKVKNKERKKLRIRFMEAIFATFQQEK